MYDYKKSLLGILVFVLIIAGLFAFRYFRGGHTEYCPLSHKFSDTADCLILHKSNGRMLIRHADRYRHDYYLEIVDHGRSYKYEIPEYKANGSRPKKFRVRLIDSDPSAVTINGERYELLSLRDGG